MCGIAGTVRIGDLALVRRMTDLMAYRGPDDSGLYEDGEVRLGHRRLSIIDLSSAGHQPMETEDGALVVTFNGEIYNFLELRADLERKGYRFRTSTDTEVILFAYAEYGVDCVEHLEGMFGFALWDRKQKQLLLARDRTGMKPLFYFQDGDGLAFASELKPLLCLPNLDRRVNRAALRSVVRYASNLEQESLLASVYKLPPGHRLVWRNGTCDLSPYWTHPLPSPEPWSEEVLVRELQDRLAEVVRSHLVSDAPLGAALSGGLDSSGIVALMARESPGRIDTYTVGFGGDDPDLAGARRVAEHCKTNHHEILVQAQNLSELLPRVVWHLEEPLGQMETVQMYANYQEAARQVRVLLVGEGADECFAGYQRYKMLHPRLPLPMAVRKDLYEQVYQHNDSPTRTLAGRFVSRCVWRDAPLSPLADPTPRIAGPLGDVKHSGHAIERALAFDQRTILPHLYLKRADALGMAHSLELRVPFMDRRMVELAARIPGEMLLRRGVEKYILRRAFAPLLPDEITWRKKYPLQMRVNRGLVATLDEMCDTLLRPEDVRARGFFDPARVDELRRRRPSPTAPPPAHKFWTWRIWSMLLCETWARMFLDRPIPTTPPASLRELA